MFKKLNSKIGLTFLIVLALLIMGVAYMLYTSDSDEVKSARQSSEGRLVESDDVVVERAGTWSAQAAKSASSGSYLYSSGSPDDVLTLTFVGSRVEVLYTTGSNLGTLAVDVGHTVLRTVITADQATQYQERTVVDYLDDGLHTLRVYAQEGGVIGIDAFRISRPSTAEFDAIPINMAKIGDNVLESAIANGGASIIILLQEPTVPYSNEAVYKENIKQTQGDVLGSLAVGHFEVSHLYKTLPGFAGYADFNAILELQSNSLVKSIELDSSGGGSIDSLFQFRLGKRGFNANRGSRSSPPAPPTDANHCHRPASHID